MRYVFATVLVYVRIYMRKGVTILLSIIRNISKPTCLQVLSDFTS
jgi:hypothetical protein